MTPPARLSGKRPMIPVAAILPILDRLARDHDYTTIAQHAGISERLLHRVRTGGSQQVELATVDRILTAFGLEHELHITLAPYLE